MTLFEAISNSLLAQYREDFDEAYVMWDRDVVTGLDYSAIYSSGRYVVLDVNPHDYRAPWEAWEWNGVSWLRKPWPR